MEAENKDDGGPVVEQGLNDEIEGAVTEVVETAEKERAAVAAAAVGDEPGKTNLSTESTKAEKVEVEKETPAAEGESAEAKPGAITDTLIERAVKAGLSLADAKAFQQPEALERICVTLEKHAGTEEKQKKDDTQPPEVDPDPLASIPDLDPETYDENVVAGFKAMKEIIRKQQEALSGIQREGKARAGSWFDSQVAALGEAFVDVVGNGDRAKLDPASPQAAKLAELKGKFDVLEAGYKAAGQSVEQAAVFKEAVAIVLGDVQAKTDASLKAGALEKRKALHINRPSGVGIQPQADALADAAAALDRKYFGKR